MNWGVKLMAMKALVGHDRVRVVMRVQGEWYVYAEGRFIDNGQTRVIRYGSGHDPESAVNADWHTVVENLQEFESIKVNGNNWRWNGESWETVAPIKEKDNV